MRAFCALYLEGFRWLRRDKIFLPILFAGLGVAIFASTVSQWSLEDMKKILFDIGFAGFRLTGGMVSILWGSRMIHDAISERSIDPRLAAPISRSVWFLARYSALATAILVMGVVFAIWWQGILYSNGYGRISQIQGWALGFLVLEWLVLGAIAMLTATFGGFGISIFASVSLWLVGLMAPLVSASKDPNFPATESAVVDWLADVWNFQRFNLIDQLAVSGQDVILTDVSMRALWAVALLCGVLTAGTWRFSERDLT
jgi:hypothetical protein